MPGNLKKNVSVSFAGDDEAITHIIPEENEKFALAVRGWSLSKASAADQIEEESDEGEEAGDVFRQASALVDEEDVLGSHVFGFRTPKRSGQMALKASSSVRSGATPKSGSRGTRNMPKGGSKGATPTGKGAAAPKSILKKGRVANLLKESGQTPAGKRSRRRLHKLNAQTPHRLRARNKANASSGSEDSGPSDSEWEDDAISTHSGPVENIPPPPPENSAEVKKRGRPRKDQVESETVENYFEAQSAAAVTSDHTLARLQTPRMDQQQLNEALQGVSVAYPRERVALMAEHRACFTKWMFLMCNNYNVLLHGLGSKRPLLEEFRTSQVNDLDHVVIHGFFPSLTLKSILNAITEDILGHRGNFRSPLDQTEFIVNHYSQPDAPDLFLLIHNLDGPMLRAEKVQTALSLLAQAPNVHVIACIDHINAPLMWDHARWSRFGWLWFDVTCYESYADETSYENSLLVQQSGVLAFSALCHVMRSLTPNAQAIFMLLARYQLENKENNYQGLAFPDLYQRCREAFLVNSDLTLRSQLTEFKDHKLVRTKKGVDGVEYLLVALDNGTLKEFLAQQEES